MTWRPILLEELVTEYKEELEPMDISMDAEGQLEILKKFG
jgi:hypothetical protein